MIMIRYIRTNEVRWNFPIGKSSSGISSDEVFAVWRIVNFDDRFEVVVVPGVYDGVSEHNDGGDCGV